MEITGRFSEQELIEYIGLKIKLETLRSLANSIDITAEEKETFFKVYLQEDR